jgi:hypothetical protein
MIEAVLASGNFFPEVLTEIQKSRRCHQRKLYQISKRLFKAEQAAEIIEGAARFVELGLERYSKEAMRSPTSEQPNKAHHDRGLSITDGRYYYATGYAMMSMLDINGQPWRRKIIQHGLDVVFADLIASLDRNK